MNFDRTVLELIEPTSWERCLKVLKVSLNSHKEALMSQLMPFDLDEIVTMGDFLENDTYCNVYYKLNCK